MTDKPTQTTETPKQSIGVYIALGYLNILIFYLLCLPFVETLAKNLGYNIQSKIQDYKILIGFCVLYAIYSIIIAIFNHIAAKSPFQKSFWNLFVNNYILYLPPVTFLCILYFNKTWGFIRLINYTRYPALFIISVYVSLFLIPIMLLALLIPSWINPCKDRKRVINESITTDQQSLYIRFCNAYRHSIIGEVLYRFLYLIFPATLLFPILEGIEHNLFEFYIVVFNDDFCFLFILFCYSIFSILMRRLYTWMGRNVC